MGKVLKFLQRKNQIYLVLMFIFQLIREFLSIFMSAYFNFNNGYILTFLMVISEIIGGLFCYLYEKWSIRNDSEKYLRKKEIERHISYLEENEGFIVTQSKMNRKHNIVIIILLLFTLSLCDFIEFVFPEILTKYGFEDSRGTFKYKISQLVTIFIAIFSLLILKIKIFKHHICSLIIIVVSNILIILFENIYDAAKILNYGYFFGYLLISNITLSFGFILQKYIIEADNINPYLIVLSQGGFGIVFNSLLDFLIYPLTFGEIPLTNIPEINDTGNMILFVFCLLLYFIASAGFNINMVMGNKYFNPMCVNLIKILQVSIIIIYYFFIHNVVIVPMPMLSADYYIVNILCLLLISFFALVYTEFIIIYLCGLNKNTYLEISRRSSIESLKAIELFDVETNLNSELDEVLE